MWVDGFLRKWAGYCESNVFSAAYGLKCYVGLGNSSQRENQKIVDCPVEGYYVCVKMYGGGMGDQIRRYCEPIPAKVTFPEI